MLVLATIHAVSQYRNGKFNLGLGQAYFQSSRSVGVPVECGDPLICRTQSHNAGSGRALKEHDLLSNQPVEKSRYRTMTGSRKEKTRQRSHRNPRSYDALRGILRIVVSMLRESKRTIELKRKCGSASVVVSPSKI